ncbi:MAG TPA: class I SAM-dependent methyltransferase [Gemmatimonadales bacterium]|nr:class I SAM-dependent methyltransferase [Gemmatimonadales bacterium]
MLSPKFRTARSWRRARRTLIALAAAGLVLVLAGFAAVGASLFGAVLVSLTVLEAALLRELLVEGQRRQYALTQIRPLFGEIPPDLGGWAADPVLIHHAVRLIADVRPRLVLECGSGSSTIAIARSLATLGGRIISLEHDPEFARRSMALIQLYGVERSATVITAPLRPRDIDGRTFQWYGPEYESILSGLIDVMVVDGPPKAIGPRARYPAVPALMSQLAPECWILMDDGDRADERAIAHAWSQDLGAQLTYLEGGRGGWLLHRRSQPGAGGPAGG